MADTIKRNKKIFEYIQLQFDRLGLEYKFEHFYMNFVLPALPAHILIAFSGKFEDEVKPEILNDDTILIETLKVIGIMEASKDIKDLAKLLERRRNNRGKEKNNKIKTDFDKLLGGIMKVPKPKEEK